MAGLQARARRRVGRAAGSLWGAGVSRCKGLGCRLGRREVSAGRGWLGKWGLGVPLGAQAVRFDVRPCGLTFCRTLGDVRRVLGDEGSCP